MKHKFDNMTCAEHLSGLVKFPTVSNIDEDKMDFEAFEGMHRYLEEIFPNVHKVLEKEIIGKAGLLYHWKGTGKSKQLPLLFMAHQDVVPVGNLDEWKYPPFSGKIVDGTVFGRGSGDCKHNMLAELEAVEYLLSIGYQPEYDIYLAFGYNEEVSGTKYPAAVATAELLKSRGLRFGGILDEGGGIVSGEKRGIKGEICSVVLGEKGYADFEICVKDPGGHSSTPARETALTELAKAITAINENQMPYRAISVVKDYFKTVSPYMESDSKYTELLGDVEANLDELMPYILDSRLFSAMFHTTSAVTMASGSDQANILPSKATAVVNCRLLAGDTLEDVQKHLESVVPPTAAVRLIKGNNPSPLSKTDGRLFEVIKKYVNDNYPGVPVTVDYSLGGTDARYMYGLSDYVYRFTGYHMQKPDNNIHAPNESFEIDALSSGAEFFVELITTYGAEG